MFTVMIISLIQPFTTTNAWHCQDYSPKTHNTGKLSKLIQRSATTLRSLVRTRSTSFYCYSADLYHGSSKSPFCLWYPAASRVCLALEDS